MEPEVGRFALRTFKVRGGQLHPVIALNSGQHWQGGVCKARCVMFEDPAFEDEAKTRQMDAAANEQWRIMLNAELVAAAQSGQGSAVLGQIVLDYVQALEEAELPAHQAPDKDCRCGIYGSLSLHNLRKQFPEALFLVAVIAAEGKTIIGSRGLRTEFARIVALWVPWYHFAYKRVARTQCPDATLYTNLDKMLADYHLPRHPDKTVQPDPNASCWWTA